MKHGHAGNRGRPSTGFNDHVCFGDIVEVRLSDDLVFVVDAEDLQTIRPHHWSRCAGGYVRAVIGGRHVLLHRFLVHAKEEEEVDHEDGDGFNNRRSNLRVATKSQNRANRTRLAKNNNSGFHGVRWHAGKWVASIQKDKKRYYLGRFSDPRDAARAYNEKARELFGEFACRLNDV